MTDVMQRCVPISNGILAPDLRVNYQFGLVLGVDEFEQEDRYLRERDERAARVLHGYGTATGLHVSAARPAAAPLDVEARVEPGVAIDQWGRPVVVRSAQCARIGAWIAEQETAALAAGTTSPLVTYRRPSGDVTVYVVASYAECDDALVPIPGNPCADDDDLLAASRIRDSWQLELRWEPPAMPAWDGIRALADLLAGVDTHDASPFDSDEDILAEHIRALVPGAPPAGTPLPPRPLLPRADARRALDRLLTLWLTEVRPALAPDLLDPDSKSDGDPAVLLTAITVVPADQFAAAPAIVSFASPDDEGRPYLAPTELIQELVNLGGGGVTTIVAGSPIQQLTSKPLIQVATISTIGAAPARRLVLWSHLGVPVNLGASVAVRRNAGAMAAFAVAAGPVAGSFQLRPPNGAPLLDDELLEVQLDLDRILVRDVADGSEVPASTWLRRATFDLTDRQENVVVVHHVVEDTPPEPDPPPAPISLPVRTVVTATPRPVEERPEIELWWHVDKIFQVDEERVVNLPNEAISVLAETEGQATPVNLRFDLSLIRHNVFRLVVSSQDWREQADSSPFLRVLVQLDGVRLESFGDSVANYGRALGVEFADNERESQVLTLFVRLPGKVE